MTENKTLIIIPTFNELDNITKLIPDLLSRSANPDILIVDDNSPDGTADFIQQMAVNNDRIHLIKREKKWDLALHTLKDLNLH